MARETELHIHLDGGYRITRLPATPGGGDDGRWCPATYVVYRPDGSELCRDVHWPDVERAINADSRQAGREEAALSPLTTPGRGTEG